MHKAWDILGIDLAWHGQRNTSAIALGRLDGDGLVVRTVYPAVRGIAQLAKIVHAHMPRAGVAIDAPLRITNVSGQRPCEKELSCDYGSRHAGCHPANLTLYPRPSGVLLSERLSALGFAHLGRADSHFQIECYPHPAMIEIFGLAKRLPYKKGTVADKKEGQITLSRLIRRLEGSPVLKLRLEGEARAYTEEDRIRAISGNRLKENEDALDSLICTYIAALYQGGVEHKVYGSGNLECGYIYVPQQKCI